MIEKKKGMTEKERIAWEKKWLKLKADDTTKYFLKYKVKPLFNSQERYLNIQKVCLNTKYIVDHNGYHIDFDSIEIIREAGTCVRFI